ncbi:putative membrane protein YabM [Thalassobacillus devorans]|uniref:Membrane protein YabM n=3 Tax=Thalassobacillus devorans TaxID=279813 RepID=A0ABQ1PUT4_9BACI|nr:putative membrane protein YabM [Thalassobacillus devorans]
MMERRTNMNDKIETKDFFKGAFILTLAGIFSKILSAGYRIPIQNITGDLGFYIYQQIYPFLGVAIMLSLYGFPVAVSKLAADFRDKQKELALRSFFIPVFVIIFSLSAVVFLILFTQAGMIAEWMGDKRLSSPIRASALVFLVLPFTSVMRGAFQGSNDMQPTAVSQIVEQLVRVSIIITIAVALVGKEDYYAIGTGAAAASVAGSIAAAIFLGMLAWKRRSREHYVHREHSYRYFLKTILIHGLFISINYMFLLLIQMADAFTLVPGLEGFGLDSYEARVSKGVFDRGQPLIQLGAVLGSSLALALIPTITKQRLEREPDKFHEHLQSALKMSLLLAAGATAGLIIIFPYVNELLYQNSNGTSYLRILMIVVLFSSLAITTSSVLQGVDVVFQTAGVILAGTVLKWAGNEILVPVFGLSGAAWASVVAAALVLIWNLKLMRRRFRPSAWRSLPFIKILTALVVMAIFLMLAIIVETYLLLLESRFGLLIFTLSVSGLGGIIYFITFTLVKGFTDKEMEQIPAVGAIFNWFSRRKHKHAHH